MQGTGLVPGLEESQERSIINYSFLENPTDKRSLAELQSKRRKSRTQLSNYASNLLKVLFLSSCLSWGLNEGVASSRIYL